MKAAIICSGSTVKMFDEADRSQYDLVVCVNRTVNTYKCDYWSWLDRRTLDFVDQLPYDCTWVTKSIHVRYVKRSIEPVPRMVELETFAGEISPLIKWRNLSSLCGVVFAKYKGAKVIDCYGMDWEGKEDFDGFYDECQDRNPKRWNREKDQFTCLQELFQSEKLELNRIYS